MSRMSIAAQVTIAGIGFMIGTIGPRLPTLFVTRTKGFNKHFPPHPEPIPLSPFLTQRILHLRKFYHGGIALAGIILLFGYLSLRWGSGPFGFGLWIGAGWFTLSRLQLLALGDKGPWHLGLANDLQMIRNSIEANPCCQYSTPSWHLTSVKCDSCGTILQKMQRPDLGRKRSDGFFVGLLRLMISDSYPIARMLDNDEEE